MPLITVSRLGALRGLQYKRGQGFDLRRMGKANITRISEVFWNEPEQAWYVQFLRGELTQCSLTLELIRKVGAGVTPSKYDGLGIAYFIEYEDAVKAEIAVVEAARKSGEYRLV